MTREWLKEIRTDAQLSYVELGKIVGCGGPHLNDIEKGRRNPSGALAFKLSKALEFDITKFYEENPQI